MTSVACHFPAVVAARRASAAVDQPGRHPQAGARQGHRRRRGPPREPARNRTAHDQNSAADRIGRQTREIDSDWCEHDPSLRSHQQDLAEENRRLRGRVGAGKPVTGRTRPQQGDHRGGPAAATSPCPPGRRGRHPLTSRSGCVDRSGQGYAIAVVGRDDGPEEGAAITRDEAQEWFTQFLLRRVRRDDYPSTTQLDLIEKSIPRELLDEYLRVLVDKVAHDRYPSIPLLYRIQHLIKHLPHSGYEHRPYRAEREDTEHNRTTATEPDKKTGAAASTRADEEKSR
jgi:hypothetical protein